MAQERIDLVVRGRVQGVDFRRVCGARGKAPRAHRLGDWADGAVEVVAEGEEDQVKDFLGRAQHGPATARVDKVDTRWRSYTGEFAGSTSSRSVRVRAPAALSSGGIGVAGAQTPSLEGLETGLSSELADERAAALAAYAALADADVAEITR